MKHSARILLAAVILAAVSTAFAQAQRWEYASVSVGGGRTGAVEYIFEAPGVRLDSGVIGEGGFLALIKPHLPFPGWLEGAALSETMLLNLLGNAGWELTTSVGMEPLRVTHFFKRPLLE